MPGAQLTVPRRAPAPSGPGRARVHQFLPERVLATVLVTLVVGNWGLGKGFAYAGYYPVFIGDVCLVAGFAIVLHRGVMFPIRTGSARVLALLCAVVAAQSCVSVLLLGQSPIDVVRNTAPVLYSGFAYLTYFVLARRARAGGLTAIGATAQTCERVAVPVVLALATVTTVVGVLGLHGLPSWPRVAIPLAYFKSSDLSVPLVVVVVLWLRRRVRLGYLLWALALLLVCMSASRGVLAAVVVTLVVVRPSPRRLAAVAACGLLAFGTLAVTDASLTIGGYRQVSRTQLVANLGSLVGDKSAESRDPSAANTAAWRYAWWGKIFDDSLEGTHPVLGLGWGTNLASRYGFDISDPDGLTALRSPHNVLMGVVGRGGWLAGALWVAFYVTLLVEIARAVVVARRRRLGDLLAILEVAAAVVVAGIVVGLTDVFLESPQNAIPHWIFIGTAWFAITSVRAASAADESAAR